MTHAEMIRKLAQVVHELALSAERPVLAVVVSDIADALDAQAPALESQIGEAAGAVDSVTDETSALAAASPPSTVLSEEEMAQYREPLSRFDARTLCASHEELRRWWSSEVGDRLAAQQESEELRRQLAEAHAKLAGTQDMKLSMLWDKKLGVCMAERDAAQAKFAEACRLLKRARDMKTEAECDAVERDVDAFLAAQRAQESEREASCTCKPKLPLRPLGRHRVECPARNGEDACEACEGSGFVYAEDGSSSEVPCYRCSAETPDCAEPKAVEPDSGIPSDEYCSCGCDKRAHGIGGGCRHKCIPRIAKPPPGERDNDKPDPVAIAPHRLVALEEAAALLRERPHFHDCICAWCDDARAVIAKLVREVDSGNYAEPVRLEPWRPEVPR